MSTATSAPTTSRAMTLAQRRRAVLDRGGLLSSRRIAQKPANMTFFVIFFTVLTLVAFGLVMVMSSSSIVALNRGLSPWKMFFKQLMWACFGGLGMAFLFRFPYSMLRSFVFPVLVGAYALMFLPFVPNIGVSTNGARAWVAFGPVGFQPSELLKLALLVYCANLLGRRQKEVADFNRTTRPVMVALIISVLLCLMQRDLGGAIVMTCIVLTVMCLAGIPMRIVNSIAGSAVLAALFLTLVTSSRRNRWTAFLNLDETKGSFGYQVWQSILSISNGGISGVGVGAGTGKWGYVPLAHSDFIFSTIAEEMGLIGVTVVIGGFLTLVVAGLRAALGAEERFGALLAGGITMWFALQAIINIGGVTGSMPVTGLTLPLISYGGSSLLVCMSAAGLLMNVARNMK
ncbi:MAG: putative lipid II flippase FtsW [Actinobacteria bacterium]|nr:putative lipid II flippase FtsW [Acidimicrobiia bacterium]NDF66671.1 putative lipid II flippase FtsW [Actinomycetota bacterium]